MDPYCSSCKKDQKLLEVGVYKVQTPFVSYVAVCWLTGGSHILQTKKRRLSESFWCRVQWFAHIVTDTKMIKVKALPCAAVHCVSVPPASMMSRSSAGLRSTRRLSALLDGPAWCKKNETNGMQWCYTDVLNCDRFFVDFTSVYSRVFVSLHAKPIASVAWTSAKCAWMNSKHWACIRSRRAMHFEYSDLRKNGDNSNLVRFSA